MGLPTSRNPDTPEGLECRMSVRIHRIPAELLQSIELELQNLRRTRTLRIPAEFLQSIKLEL
jgi:hypothetical protein